jgi:peptidoglycan/xylan/chitin deacetylase (PgdA/CDA1 family)
MACHGNVHEPVEDLDEAAERRILQEQMDIYEKYLGLKPQGYRSPSWHMNNRTPALLKEHGFLYDSSLMGTTSPTSSTRLRAAGGAGPAAAGRRAHRHVYGATNAIAEPTG